MAESAARRGTRIAVGSAVRAAAQLMRVRWCSVLVAMMCVQGVLVWALPLVVSLVQWMARRLGSDGINLPTVGTTASSVLGVLVLLTTAVVATLLVLAEVTLFAVIAHLALEGEEVTFASVLRRSRVTARRMVRPQGLALMPHLILLLPISVVGFSAVLTRDVVLPQFVRDELLVSARGALLLGGVTIPVFYVMLRLLLVPAIISGSDDTIGQAVVRSWRMTHWRALFGFGAVLLGTTVAGSVVLALVAAIGLGPVVLADTHSSAGIVLALVDLARFLVTGAVAAFIAFFLAAYFRESRDLPLDVRPAAPANWATRVAAATVLLLSAAIATPHLVAHVDIATRAGSTAALIIGHRGYPARAVENSVEGLRVAVDAGADMVEADVQETGDGGLVLMHDVGLGRMTGTDRNVYELTTSQVTGLTLRQGGRTARVPTLAEFVAEADERGVQLLVEVKQHGHEEPGFATRLVAELARVDPDRTHMIQSRHRELIAEIADLDPDRPTAYVSSHQLGSLPAAGADILVLEDWSVHDRLFTEARRQGRQLYTWTVNDSGALGDHLTRGVDGVITDEVDRAVAARDRIHADPLAFYLERARGMVAIG